MLKNRSAKPLIVILLSMFSYASQAKWKMEYSEAWMKGEGSYEMCRYFMEKLNTTGVDELLIEADNGVGSVFSLPKKAPVNKSLYFDIYQEYYALAARQDKYSSGEKKAHWKQKQEHIYWKESTITYIATFDADNDKDDESFLYIETDEVSNLYIPIKLRENNGYRFYKELNLGFFLNPFIYNGITYTFYKNKFRASISSPFRSSGKRETIQSGHSVCVLVPEK